MLIEILIENVALIDRLRLELGPGLNVLTGETGAGKSIVVGALTMVLGARADRSLIRSGFDKAKVEAVFDVSKNEEAKALLDEMGLEAEDGYCPIAREISTEGRGLCRVCRGVVPLSHLKRLAATMVELHGQNEHQRLSDPARHMEFLDAFGDDDHARLMKSTSEAYSAFTAAKRELDGLKNAIAMKEQMRETLSFQLSEIDAVKPKLGEAQALEKKSLVYHNSEKIATSVNRAYEMIYRGSGRGASAIEALKKASDALGAISDIDERFDRIKSKVDEVYYLAEDAGYELQALNESIEFDPREADRVAQRLIELKRVTRKYGPEIEDVIAKRENILSQLDELEKGDETVKRLDEQLKNARNALERISGELTSSRRALAEKLTCRIEDELGQLGMKNARFEVRIDKCPYGSKGADKVEFMLSANLGEPVKPLAEVASGGELSRIMLALKTVEAEISGVDSMVFDEIDTGISGRMAQVVGEKMALIAKTRQVICVTHLPQIAALGGRQYLVTKLTGEGRTGSTVELLDYEGRVKALAQMISGAGGEESSTAHARNMLKNAQALIAK